MVLLPCLLVCFFLFRSGYCVGETSAGSGQAHTSCPGICTATNTLCNAALNMTNCGKDTICCLDERHSNTESLQHIITMESVVPQNEFYDVEESTLELKADRFPVIDLYSQEFDLSPKLRHIEKQDENNCPGACVPSHYAKLCHYVLNSVQICNQGSTCCVTTKDVARLQRRSDYEKMKSTPLLRRVSLTSTGDNLACPGTCVHTTYLMFCEKILPEFPCPISAKCCNVKILPQKVFPNANVQNCAGQCIPYHLHGFCISPNELVMSSTCSRGSTCCMRRPSALQKPIIQRINFPEIPTIDKFSSTDKNAPKGGVLGYLASDDEGTIFKVSSDGQMSPLPRLTAQDHINTFVNVAKFEHPDGTVLIFSDPNGFLYQKFAPYAQRVTPIAFGGEQTPPQIKQFLQVAFAHTQSGINPAQRPSEQLSQMHLNGNPIGQLGSSEAIVITEVDDKALVPSTTPTPLVKRKNSRPSCPGSCMSYFLRFTCFRGYAIYDGFSCGGRSVCCAKLKDIEDHEQYLKSLSPYFNAPPSSRDPVLPRCGIKGRRDTPRVMGGEESVAGKWCWQVAVINMENQYICGGALIDNSWVLTAAHCVAGPMRENQALYVRAGVTDLKSPEDNGAGQTVRVLSTFMHHNFKSINLDNDIALLRLQKPVDLVTNVCVICLPTTGHMPKDETKCTVTGYGFVSNGGTMSLKIREAKVPLVDELDCMSNVTEALSSPFILPANTFCAGGHGHQDACQGDAGGPLACEIGGYYELIGLVSWSLGCGRSDVPSIYVKVPSFMGWINQIISSSSFLTTLN